MTKTKWARWTVALFFLALTAAGLAMGADYGVPWDEAYEQQIVQQNLHEYAVHLLGSDSEAARWYASRNIPRISQSIERDHGECAYYPAAPLLTALSNQPESLRIWWHAYTWLWFMAGVWALYALCRETGLTRPISCMGALLLYLCPRFFGEGHYNNKDMVLLSLVLLTLWLGARFLRRQTPGRGFLLSLAGAMAANTKIIGLFVWGLMGLAAVILVSVKRRWSGRMAATAIGTIASFAAFYALLTPALWSDAGGFWEYLLTNSASFTRWHGVVLFRGATFAKHLTPLPWYYIPWMMVLTLPVYVLPLAAVGQLATVQKVFRQKAAVWASAESLTLLAASFSWFVPLCYAVVARPVVYNGWRHFYFVYAGIALMGTHGIAFLVDFLRRRTGEFGMHRLFAAGMCLFYLWMAIGIVQNHPYEYAYYNRIERAGAEERLELDYWNVHTLNLLKELLADERRNPSLPLEISARDEKSLSGLVQNLPQLEESSRARLTVSENRDAPYLYANTTYSRIYGVAPPQGYHELLKVKSYGLVLGVIYEKDAP